MSEPGTIGAIMAEAVVCFKRSLRGDLTDEERQTDAMQSAACSLIAISNVLLALCEDARFGMLIADLRDRPAVAQPEVNVEEIRS
jgi:hypothetical protein